MFGERVFDVEGAFCMIFLIALFATTEVNIKPSDYNIQPHFEDLLITGYTDSLCSGKTKKRKLISFRLSMQKIDSKYRYDIIPQPKSFWPNRAIRIDSKSNYAFDYYKKDEVKFQLLTSLILFNDKKNVSFDQLKIQHMWQIFYSDPAKIASISVTISNYVKRRKDDAVIAVSCNELSGDGPLVEDEKIFELVNSL